MLETGLHMDALSPKGFGLLDCVPRIFSTSPPIVKELKLRVDMANTELVVSHVFCVLPAQKEQLESLPFQLTNGLHHSMGRLLAMGRGHHLPGMVLCVSI